MNAPFSVPLPAPNVIVPLPDPPGMANGGAGMAVQPLVGSDGTFEPLEAAWSLDKALARLEAPGTLELLGSDGSPDGGCTQIVNPLVVLTVMVNPATWPPIPPLRASVRLPVPALGIGRDGGAGVEKHPPVARLDGLGRLGRPGKLGRPGRLGRLEDGDVAEVRLAAAGVDEANSAVAPNAPAPRTTEPVTPAPSFHSPLQRENCMHRSFWFALSW